MHDETNVSIAAIITTDKNKVSGGAPIFVVSTPEGLQDTAAKLEDIMDAAAHELDPETIIIVKH